MARLARRRRPQEGAGGRVEAVHGAGAAAMHELLVVMQVEGVEVGTLAAFDLLDAQDLAFQQFDCLASAGLQEMFGNDLAAAHRAVSASVRRHIRAAPAAPAIRGPARRLARWCGPSIPVAAGCQRNLTERSS